MSDARDEAVFIQHAESYRYQDALKWSRVKTAAVIEGAILYGAWSASVPDAVKKVGVIFGSLFIGVLCFLVYLDKQYATMHLNAMKKYEEPAQLPFSCGRFRHWGTGLLMGSLILVIVLNVCMLPFIRGTSE